MRPSARTRPALAALMLLLLAAGAAADVRGYAARPRLTHGPARPAGLPRPGNVVDPFESAAGWKPMPADGVEMKLSTDSGAVGRSLRVDFRFVKGGGYAVLHRDLSLDLPENYRFRFRVRGECPNENLEFKLIDSTGANVWWCNRRDFAFPRAWQMVSTRRRQISFAWGPAGGGEIRHVAAIEFAVTAGSGGQGTVWLDQLELEPLPPAGAAPPRPVASASSAQPGHGAALAVDGDSASTWLSRPGDRLPALTLDLGIVREFSAVLVDWAGGRRLRDYVLEASDDGTAWSAIREVKDGGRARDWLFLPDHEARRLRLRATRPVTSPIAIAAITVEPPEWSSNANAFFRHIAQASPRGTYPRGISGEQSYWSIVNSDGGQDAALLGEDGALEVGRGRWSLEPFLVANGRVISWADVRTEHSIAGGFHPPTVRWIADSLELRITARPDSARRPSFLVLYRVENRARSPQNVTFALAVRPFQVNPPSQFLNTPGGVAPIRGIETDGREIRVDPGPALLVRPGPEPTRIGVMSFDAGELVERLARGAPPGAREVRDPAGLASAVITRAFPLPTLFSAGTLAVEVLPRGAAPQDDPAYARAQRAWDRARPPAQIGIAGDPDVAPSVLAQIGWILASRDSAALRPGTRAYARSWIRDGALISSALLRMGKADVVREYIDWFAPYQYEDGKVPCCVDARGSDPVPEYDSDGEFIWLVAEYVRFTADTTLARRLWPHVRAAAAHLDSLRAQRRTAEWATPERREFFGLLPPSISHEGYSAKPMHSYWDDLFALRGYRDAAWLAGDLALADDARRLAASRDQFTRDLGASVAAAMAKHRIDYVPGCADLGDFDATSTTIALSPVQAESLLGRPALERTFERYWEFFRDRRDGRHDWDAYTPYEMRTIGAFVRLGWRARADSLLQWFMKGQRPAGWRQWPEVVWKDGRAPHFLGDLPHAWVGSDFVRSVLDMLAYEREGDGALVVGAGVPERWMGGDGVVVRGLRTTRGELSYTLHASGRGIAARIEAGVRLPVAGLILAPPGITPGWRALVDGAPAPISTAGTVRITSLPATVLLTPP